MLSFALPLSSLASDPGPAQGAAARARTDSRLRLRGFQRSHTRIRNRGAWPTTTVLSFGLSKAARLVLLVRGPGPSCKLAGRIPIAGHKGLNLFAFDGTIRNRPLDSGTYLLITRSKGGTKDLARTYVTIVARKSAKKSGPRPKCSQRSPLAPSASAVRIFGFPGPDFFQAREASTGTGGSPASSGGDTTTTGTKAPPQESGGVLGEQTPQGSGLPELPAIERPEGVSGFLVVLLLALLLASLLGLVFAVIHHLRQPRVRA